MREDDAQHLLLRLRPRCSRRQMPGELFMAAMAAPLAESYHSVRGPSRRHPASQRRRTRENAGGGFKARVTPTLSVERHRSEEHTSELQSLMRISYAVFCLKKKKIPQMTNN